MPELYGIDPLRDDRVLRMGRYTGREECFPLHWTGSGVRLTAACTCLEAEFEAEYRVHAPWVAVLADGAPVARFPLGRGKSRVTVLAGMNADFAHAISLVRDSQPVEGDGGALRLRRLFTDGEVTAPPKPKWNIGFLGDSLTVGEGCLGPGDGQEWIGAWMSGTLSYGGTALRALGARGRFLCQGGYGVYCGWNGDPNGNIPRLYESVCLPEGAGEAYDFSLDPLDAVVINLGTNDHSALMALPEAERPGRKEELKRAAVSFLETVRRREKNAVLLWAYGMCGNELDALFRLAVEERRRAGDERCFYLSLRPAGPEEYGCRAHPAWSIQREEGLQIAAELEKRLTEKA